HRVLMQVAGAQDDEPAARRHGGPRRMAGQLGPYRPGGRAGEAPQDRAVDAGVSARRQADQALEAHDWVASHVGALRTALRRGATEPEADRTEHREGIDPAEAPAIQAP